MLAAAQNLLSNLGKLEHNSINHNPSKLNQNNDLLSIKALNKQTQKNALKNDYNTKADINSTLIKNPESTFLIKVTGNSMIDAGINSGDILVVDRSLKPTNRNIIVAALNDKLLVKRYVLTDNEIELMSENTDFANIKVKTNDKFEVWGVVKSIIKILEN